MNWHMGNDYCSGSLKIMAVCVKWLPHSVLQELFFLWFFVGVWHSGITWYDIMWWCQWTFSSVYLWNYGYSYVPDCI